MQALFRTQIWQDNKCKSSKLNDMVVEASPYSTEKVV